MRGAPSLAGSYYAGKVGSSLRLPRVLAFATPYRTPLRPASAFANQRFAGVPTKSVARRSNWPTGSQDNCPQRASAFSREPGRRGRGPELRRNPSTTPASLRSVDGSSQVLKRRSCQRTPQNVRLVLEKGAANFICRETKERVAQRLSSS